MKSYARGRDSVRLAIPVVWAAGMFAARRDPWVAIGIAAALLVTAAVATDAARVAALLRPTSRLLVIAVAAAAVMIAFTDFSFPMLLRWVPSLRGMGHSVDHPSAGFAAMTPARVSSGRGNHGQNGGVPRLLRQPPCTIAIIHLTYAQ